MRLSFLRLMSRLICVFAMLAAASTAYAQPLEYPPAKRLDLVEDYHGTKVAAPYRWLEEDSSPETRAWVEAQNRLTFGYLEKLPQRAKLQKRLTEIWNAPRYSAPEKRGDRYFYTNNSGLQNQDVLYMQESLQAEPEVVLDPNKLSDDGTAALTGAFYSRDGKYLAYGVSLHGSDKQIFYALKLDGKEKLKDKLEWCKFTSIAWVPDSSGFYYNRYSKPGTVAEEDENKYNRVYWHRLGTSQDQDRLIFEYPEEKEFGFQPSVSDDGKFLVLTVWVGTDPKYGLYFMPLDEKGQPAEEEFTRMIEPGEALYEFIENDGPIFFLRTDRNAPRGRIIAVDSRTRDPKGRREIVPESADEVIGFAAMAYRHLVVAYMKDAHHVLRSFTLDGKAAGGIELPGLGSVRGLSASKEDPEVFFPYTSFLQPPVLYRYDFTAGKSSVFKEPEVPFDPSGYETRQVFFKSKDGTRVPMFLTHRKGLKPDGNTPVLMYGYGGFNINLTPYYSSSRLVFLEAGGIYALVNLRGGSEYGEDWHREGMLGNKQNVFDDFIAAAESLVSSGYTRSEKLAILGGSNGGLLVTACMLQRPDLFGAVVAAVPVTDMLRYHRFTVGHYWTPEYGNAEKDPFHFEFLHAYSPLHNIPSGVKSPPILVTTADTDDRVVPSHSRKFVAAMQHAAAGENPVLIRIETKAGHGRGKPTAKRIEEAADMYSFIFHHLGME